MKRIRLLTSISVVLILAMALPALAKECQQPQYEISEELARSTLADFVSVNVDGTLILRAEAVERIPERYREGAWQSLRDLNEAIRNGHEEPFTVTDHRLGLSPSPAKVKQHGLTLTSQRSDQGRGAICFCRDDCCSAGLCCESGFFIFCFRFGVC